MPLRTSKVHHDNTIDMIRISAIGWLWCVESGCSFVTTLSLGIIICDKKYTYLFVNVNILLLSSVVTGANYFKYLFLHTQIDFINKFLDALLMLGF